MAIRKITLFTMAALLMTGCADGRGNKELLGTLGGAAAGGYLGSKVGGGTGQLAATAAGVLIGGFLGGQLGKQLDELDRMKLQQTTQQSLEYQRDTVQSSWSNPNTGNSGTITPVRTYQVESGQYCREFQQTVVVGGQTEQAFGTACRQPDGTWKIVQN